MRFFEIVVVFTVAEAAVLCIVTRLQKIRTLFDSCHAAVMRFFEIVVVFTVAEAAVLCIVTRLQKIRNVTFISISLYQRHDL